MATEKKEDWNELEIPKEKKEEKVEYEVEGEEKQTAPETKVKKEVQEEVPQELEGIETKGAQKRIRQLVKQRKDRDSQISQLINQNEQLNQILHQKDSQFNEVSRLNLNASEKQLNDKVDLARNSYLEAFESQDKEKLLKAQEMLNEAQNDLKTVQVTKHQFPEQQVQQPQVQQQVQQQFQQPQPTPDPKAQDWASQNKWFGKDNIMTAAALAIDVELKNEGFNPTDPEFYQEIDQRLKANFPHKFTDGKIESNRKEGSSSTPSQVVAGGSRSSPSSKKVKLTKDDIRLAEKWAIPLEQYAQEKLKADKAEGDYTTINMQRGG